MATPSSFYKLLVSLLVMLAIITVIFGHNKYSEHSNLLKKKPMDYKNLGKPFRMAKINLLWQKAQKILTEQKLESLYSELMVQDKHELTLKKLKAEASDKEGLKEAELRKKLRGIMNQYGLMQHFENDLLIPKLPQDKAFNEASEESVLKSMFKDKKLNKLWYKAEQSGLSKLELKVLKEEFMHHQQKINQYYELMETIQRNKDTDQNELENDIRKFDRLEELEEKTVNVLDHTNKIREIHKNIKDGYEKLLQKTGNKNFKEPRVDGLWKLAQRSDFTEEELESLRVELSHYEQRILKLRHLQGEIALSENRYPGQDAGETEGEGLRSRKGQLQERERRVEKLHSHLEKKIFQRRLEL